MYASVANRNTPAYSSRKKIDNFHSLRQPDTFSGYLTSRVNALFGPEAVLLVMHIIHSKRRGFVCISFDQEVRMICQTYWSIHERTAYPDIFVIATIPN